MAPITDSPRVLLVYRRHASSFVYYPALLARAGLAVDILTAPNHPARHSRHVRERFTAADSDVAFQDALAERLAAEVYAEVLFIDEPARRLAYGLPADPARDARLPIPRTNPLSAIVEDKILFQAWCEQHGLPVPRVRLPVDAEAAVRAAAALGYPVVLKGAAGAGGQAVRICADENAVREGFAPLAILGGRVMAQEFVAGPVGSVTFAARRGRVGAWDAGEKLLALKDGLGPSVVRRTRADPELGRLALAVAAAGEVSGITGFDWMETAPGRFVIIDPHFGRCTPPAVIGASSGVEFGDALRRLIDGDHRVVSPTCGGKRVALFPQIIEVVFQGRLFGLLRAAPPFARGVRYFFGPADEWRLSARIAIHYVVSGLRVLAGRLRRR